MASTGLLIVSNTKQIINTLSSLEKYVNCLYIHLNIPLTANAPAPIWSKILSQLYVDSSSKKNLDLRILVSPLKRYNFDYIRTLRPIEMIFSDHGPHYHHELCENLRDRLKVSTCPIYCDEGSSCTELTVPQASNSDQIEMYDTVVLGGTFDRIHLGHKIFLSQAVLRARQKLVVGVTTEKMTKGKTLPEFILPVEQRILDVEEFLNDIDSSIQYEVVPIDDPFGPTQTDPNMDLIVVSAETLKGGHKVNEIRAAKQLRPLKIYSIEIVESSDKDGPKESKVSSSNTRIDMLGTRLKKPEPRPNLPKSPYIIGLTGGIASGKSKMAQRFAEMGALVMDCDKIAHDIYAPGQVCFDKIVQHFGSEIVAQNGSIDRAKLGPIVFGNPEQLEALNNIVWPELMLEVKRRIAAAPSQTKVIVLEAAVLLKAGWETECHEVWSMIVPPDEAVRRVVERNGLSEEEARKRLDSQLSNKEVVSKSNVIFSSQWESEFTQKQAEKAWQMLMNELEGKSRAASSNL